MSEGIVRDAPRTLPTSTLSAIRTVELAPRLEWQITLAILDFATVFVAAGLSYGAYLLSGLGLQHYEPALYANLNLVLAAITVFSLHGSGAYRDQMGLLRIEAVRRVLYSVGTAILLLLAISYVVQFAGFSRLHVLISGPVVVVALVAQRFVVWAIADRLHTTRSTPVLVYGAGETGRVLAQQLLTDHTLGLQPVGFLDDGEGRVGEQVRVGAGVDGRRLPILDSGRQLKETIERVGATAVFLAIPSASSKTIAGVVAKAESCGVPYFVVPAAGDLVFASMQFGQVGSIPVFTPRCPTHNRFYDLSKRCIDLLVASVLLALTGPAILVAALLVKWTSRGPAFFSQVRAGRDATPFTICKLRTMHVDAPRYAQHPRESQDDRITTVGRWLRKTSIDELPQLWNVIRGEMSLVGPRPEMPFVVDKYNEIQRQRLTVKPGLTGLWQISADRAFSIHDNIHYDLYYVENRSLAIDLSILLLTPFALLGRNRAR